MPSTSTLAVSALTPSAKGKDFDDLVTFSTSLRQQRPVHREENATIRLLLHQTICSQALEHLGNRRLRHPQSLGNVDLPRLAFIVDQIRDQFDVVLHQFGAPVGSRLAKPLDVHVRVEVRDGFSCGASSTSSITLLF